MKGLSDNIKSILSIMIVLFTYSILIMLILLCRDQPTVISQVLIGSISIATGMTGYYYGYSQGASKKDEAAANQLANSQTTSTATTVTPIVVPEAPPTT